MQLYISPDAILCREGEMGRYVVPCPLYAYEEEANSDCLVYIYSLICNIFSILNKLFSILILFSHY